MKILHSEITEVIIYTDRAQVTRTAKENLNKGSHTLIFDNLPQVIEKNSIQAAGKGNAVLKDIKFKAEHFSGTPDIDENELLKQKEKVLDDLADLDDIIIHANNEKTFLQNIVNRLTFASENASNNRMPDLDPEKWVKMVDFYRTRLDFLDKDIRLQERKKRALYNELDKIERQLAESGSTNYKIRNRTEVTVEMKEEGELIINLSYIVYGPGWYPVYDIRVGSSKKDMTLEYNAMVQQNTGEDWDNTSVSLSTARPSIGGRQPDLSPWYVDIYQSVSYPGAALRSAPSPRMEKKKAAAQMFAAEAVADDVEFEEEMPAEIEKPEAEVESGFTSVVFGISGKNNIPGDNLPHKLTVMFHNFQVRFRYSTVPKLSPYAYLKVKAVNNTEFPLLPGETNIFLDGSFVANSSIDYISPSEEFWTFLGIDEGMKVEYKLIKKYHKDEGVFSKRSKLIYEYLTVITNNKKTKEEIVIWDQLPISKNAEINVSLLEPELKKDAKNPKKNEHDYLEWYFEPEPGKKIEIHFKFMIDYPREQSIAGI